MLSLHHVQPHRGLSYSSGSGCGLSVPVSLDAGRPRPRAGLQTASDSWKSSASSAPPWQARWLPRTTRAKKSTQDDRMAYWSLQFQSMPSSHESPRSRRAGQ